VPTLKDVARHVGLSVTQVSRALNDHADVSAETKTRVRQGALEIGYRPNLAARTLKSGRSGSVAMIVPGRSETVEVELLMESVMGLSAEFSRRGLRFLLHVLGPGDDPVAALETLVHGGGIDGFVLTDPVLNDPRVASLTASGTPFVLHGRDRADAAYPFVDIDNRAVGHALASTLTTRGARGIALVGGPEDRPYTLFRREGIDAALATAGARLVADLPGPMTEARGRAAGGSLPPDGIDGVIAGNMMLAAGLRAALPDIPLAVHDDRLIAFDPARLSGPLMRTEAPLDAAWAPLCDALVQAIDGEIPQVILPFQTHG